MSHHEMKPKIESPRPHKSAFDLTIGEDAMAVKGIFVISPTWETNLTISIAAPRKISVSMYEKDLPTTRRQMSTAEEEDVVTIKHFRVKRDPQTVIYVGDDSEYAVIAYRTGSYEGQRTVSVRVESREKIEQGALQLIDSNSDFSDVLK